MSTSGLDVCRGAFLARLAACRTGSSSKPADYYGTEPLLSSPLAKRTGKSECHFNKNLPGHDQVNISSLTDSETFSDKCKIVILH